MINRIQTSAPLLIAFLVLLAVGCGDAAEEPAEAVDEQPIETSPAEQTPTADVEKVNLNTGTEEQFLALPGVGEQMVHEFEEYRPYVSIEQFRQEIGKYVDEAQVAAYEQYVFVPVSPNESDEATLMQLPGVDAATASELVAMRPFDSNDAFIEALGEHVSPEQAQQARMYLASP